MMGRKEFLIFVAGLYMVERLSDTHWKFVVRVRVMAPAGMSHSSSYPGPVPMSCVRILTFQCEPLPVILSWLPIRISPLFIFYSVKQFQNSVQNFKVISMNITKQ